MLGAAVGLQEGRVGCHRVCEVEVTLTGLEVGQEGKRGEPAERGLGERGGGQGAKGVEEGAEELEAVEGVDRAQRVLALEV